MSAASGIEHRGAEHFRTESGLIELTVYNFEGADVETIRSELQLLAASMERTAAELEEVLEEAIEQKARQC